MPIGFNKSDLDIFEQNGITRQNIKDTVSSYRSKGVPDEEIYNKFIAKLASFQQQKEPTGSEETAQDITDNGQQAPSTSIGATRDILTGLTYGATPYIAGATNVIINKALGDDTPVSELFEQGKQDFKKEQAAFAQEHPKISTLSKLGGTLGGFVAPTSVVGAGAKAVNLGAKSAKFAKALAARGVPKTVTKLVETGAPRVAQTAAVFGTQEAAEGLFNEGNGISASGAIEGAVKGGLLGTAISMVTGPIGAVEAQLIENSEKSLAGAKLILSKAGVKTGSAMAEGAAIATVASGLEGETPTLEDVGRNTLSFVPVKFAGEGLTKAGTAAKEYFKPTQNMKRREEAARLVDELNQLTEEQELAEGERVLAKERSKEVAEIQKELFKQQETAKEKLKQVRQMKRPQKTYDMLADRIEGRINKREGFVTESEQKSNIYKLGETLANIGKNKAKLEKATSEYDTLRAAEERLDKKRVKENIRLTGRKNTLKATKEQEGINAKWGQTLKLQGTKELLHNEMKLQKEISDIRQAIKDIDTRRTSDIKNKNISDLRDKAVKLKEELRDKEATVRWLNAARNAKEEILRQNPYGPKSIEVINITPSLQEIEKVKKEHAIKGNPISDDYAASVATKLKINAALNAKFKDDRTLKEKIIELGQRFRTATDLLKPLDRLNRREAEAMGQEIPTLNTAGYKIRVRNRGGESMSRMKPLLDRVDDISKQTPYAVNKLGEYLNLKNRQVDNARTIANLEKAANDAYNAFFTKGISAAKKADAQKKYKAAMKELEELKAIKSSDVDTRLAAIEKNDPKIVELADSVFDYAKGTLDKLHDTGFINDEFYNILKERRGYTPERLGDFGGLFLNLEQSALNDGIGLQNSFRYRKGEEGVFKENSLLTTLLRGKQADWVVATNEAKKDALRALQNTKETWQDYNATKGLKAGQMPYYDPNDQILIWNKGKAEVWNVPKDIAKVFNADRKSVLPENDIIRKYILNPLEAANTLYKFNTTVASNTFAASNLQRDAMAAIGFSRSGKYITPELYANAAKISSSPIDKLSPSEKVLRDRFDTLMGEGGTYREAQVGIKNKETKEAELLLKEAQEANQPNSLSDGVLRTTLYGINKLLPKIGSSLNALGRGLSYLSNSSERTTRMAVFLSDVRRQAGSDKIYNNWLKNGIPSKVEAEAMSEAYKVTLDFNTPMNPIIEDLNKYGFVYIKPAIIGANRIIDVLTSPETAKQAWSFITKLGMLQAIINTEPDKEKQQLLKEQNREIMAKKFMIPKNGEMMQFSLPQEGAGLIKLNSIAAEYLIRKNKGQDIRENMWKEVADAFLYQSENTIPLFGYFSPSNLIPTQIGKAVFEVSQNWNTYSGTPIVTPRLQERPAEFQYTQSTPYLYRALGRITKISPKQIEHFFQNAGSSALQEWNDVADLLIDKANFGRLDTADLPKRPEDTKLIKMFFTTRGMGYSQNVLDLKDELKPLQQAYNAHKSGFIMKDDKDSNKKAALYKSYLTLKEEQDEIYKAMKENETKLRLNVKNSYDKLEKGKRTKEQHVKYRSLQKINAGKQYDKLEKRNNEVTNKILELVREAKKKNYIK